jgi:uncharacterized membrane protein
VGFTVATATRGGACSQNGRKRIRSPNGVRRGAKRIRQKTRRRPAVYDGDGGTGAVVMEARLATGEAERRPRLPGILLGVGLGGFVDGIVLHQILQWHHMLSAADDHPTNTVAGLEANTLADGLFHAATWVVVVVGVWILWRRASEWRWAANGRALVGWIFVGWGVFNLVEGLVDHQILGLHHVREDAGHQTAYDLGFLVFSVALCGAGWLVARPPRNRSPE